MKFNRSTLSVGLALLMGLLAVPSFAVDTAYTTAATSIATEATGAITQAAPVLVTIMAALIGWKVLKKIVSRMA
jgi:hypothetical protein